MLGNKPVCVLADSLEGLNFKGVLPQRAEPILGSLKIGEPKLPLAMNSGQCASTFNRRTPPESDA